MQNFDSFLLYLPMGMLQYCSSNVFYYFCCLGGIVIKPKFKCLWTGSIKKNVSLQRDDKDQALKQVVFRQIHFIENLPSAKAAQQGVVRKN